MDNRGRHPRFDPVRRAEWQKSVAASRPEVNAVYRSGFWRQYSQFCRGDTSLLEMAVAFLEADPYVFGSGCVKEDFIQAIKHMELPSNYSLRLQRVVLAIVDHRDGREFRDYCHLARKVDSPELRIQLMRRLTHNDANIRRRTRWVLGALCQNS